MRAPVKHSAVGRLIPSKAGHQSTLRQRGKRMTHLWAALVVTALAILFDGPTPSSALTLGTKKLKKATEKLDKQLIKAKESLVEYNKIQRKLSNASSESKERKYQRKAEKKERKLNKQKEKLQKKIDKVETALMKVQSKMSNYNARKRRKAETAMQTADAAIVRAKKFISAAGSRFDD